MPNVQQPEMRRSGEDPLVTDSVKDSVSKAAPGGAGGKDPHPVPEAQRSPYGPQGDK
jgi:hypothetical protein